MWKSIVKQFSSKYEFNDPASSADILSLEGTIQTALPEDLKKCLRESNGISGKYGLGLIWSIDQISSFNIEFRGNDDFKELIYAI